MDKRTERIEFRATPEERTSYDTARGLVPLAAWLRDLANRAAAPDPKRRKKGESEHGS